MENNEDQPITAEDLAEMLEFTNTDGKSCIEWDYWVAKMPMLTAAQAVRLMAALDPELFKGNLALKDKESAGASKIHASRLQSLAISHGMETAAPSAWLAWADSLDESVHYGFRAAVERTLHGKPNHAGGIAQSFPRNVLTTPGGVLTSYTPATTTPPSGSTHRIRTRTDPLQAIIAMARTKAANPDDYHSVWAVLVELAQGDSRPPPLLGYVETEGVKWDKGDQVKFLTKDALRKRMNPTAR